MKLYKVVGFLFLAGCGDNTSYVPSAINKDATPAIMDAGSTNVDAHVSTGPCYSDPNTNLRFADETLITQDDGVGCYAVYTVFTDHVEFFCPCPDPKACPPALTKLSNEASKCPALCK